MILRPRHRHLEGRASSRRKITRAVGSDRWNDLWMSYVRSWVAHGVTVDELIDLVASIAAVDDGT